MKGNKFHDFEFFKICYFFLYFCHNLLVHNCYNFKSYVLKVFIEKHSFLVLKYVFYIIIFMTTYSKK